MAADVLLANATVDTVGTDVTMRVFGTTIPPAKMSVQVAITGTARVQIQGRVHRHAPWVDIGERHDRSGLMYIEPISSLRAVSTGTGPQSCVSVWAAWGI